MNRALTLPSFGRRQPHEQQPSPAVRLHELARRVRRLGLCGRLGTEAAFAERDEVERELRLLAKELDRC